MTEISSQKVFTELQFYLWRVRYPPTEEWQPQIMVMGSAKALLDMHEAIRSMLDDFKTFGESTRKFLCNPPDDIDVLRYAEEHGAEIEWLIWLVLRMQSGVSEIAQYELKNKAVTVFLNDLTVAKLLDILSTRISQNDQSIHGQEAPGGLFFASSWLG
jgi:hypothetical protein